MRTILVAAALLLTSHCDGLRVPNSRGVLRMAPLKKPLPTMCEGTFEETSSPVKKLVSGLTDIVNFVAESLGGGGAEPPRRVREGVVTPAQLLSGVRADYEERMCMWGRDSNSFAAKPFTQLFLPSNALSNPVLTRSMDRRYRCRPLRRRLHIHRSHAELFRASHISAQSREFAAGSQCSRQGASG